MIKSGRKMQGTSRKTLVLFWFLLLALIGIRIRADASVLPPLLLALVLLTGGKSRWRIFLKKSVFLIPRSLLILADS